MGHRIVVLQGQHGLGQGADELHGPDMGGVAASGRQAVVDGRNLVPPQEEFQGAALVFGWYAADGGGVGEGLLEGEHVAAVLHGDAGEVIDDARGVVGAFQLAAHPDQVVHPGVGEPPVGTIDD